MAVPAAAPHGVAARSLHVTSPSSRLDPTVQIATGATCMAHQWVSSTTAAPAKGMVTSSTSFDCQTCFISATRHRNLCPSDDSPGGLTASKPHSPVGERKARLQGAGGALRPDLSSTFPAGDEQANSMPVPIRLIYNHKVSKKDLNEAFSHEFRPGARAFGSGGR